MKIITRILGFPFFVGLALIQTFVLFIKYCYNYISYGGEAIVYTMKNERKMISDIYEAILEIKKNDKPR